MRGRRRAASKQVPELRRAYLLAPVHKRSPALLRRRLRALTGVDCAGYLRELAASSLPAHLAAAEREYYALAAPYEPGSLAPSEGAMLYGLVRALRPRAVVETGTANGVSSAYILSALAANREGRLVSIDLPFAAGDRDALQPVVPGTSIDIYDASPVPQGKDAGWMVPDDLRGPWELRLGDARELLPATLAELEQIDLFFHDSLHERDHMLFELAAAWPHVREGGVLACDDVFQRTHDALPVFARSVGRTFSTFSKLGFVRK